MVRRRRSAAVLALIGAALVGCSSETPVAAPPVTVTVSPSTPAAAAAPSTTATTDGDRRCLLSDLTAGATRPDGTMNQQQVRIVWTNTSGRPCTMTGFGGADLIASPRSEDRYSLPRSSGSPATVRLRPGEQAHSVITYLPATLGGTPYTATKVLVTPPDETHSALLEWPGGPVLRQDGATHPGTVIGPVQGGSA